jgi:hypothetical protein
MLVPFVGFYVCQTAVTKRNFFKTSLAGVDEARSLQWPVKCEHATHPLQAPDCLMKLFRCVVHNIIAFGKVFVVSLFVTTY